jgi:hypothetical protein
MQVTAGEVVPMKTEKTKTIAEVLANGFLVTIMVGSSLPVIIPYTSHESSGIHFLNLYSIRWLTMCSQQTFIMTRTRFPTMAMATIRHAASRQSTKYSTSQSLISW